MNNSDWLLIAVIAVAFIAGYSIVSFIVKKMKSQQYAATPGKDQADESQQQERWEQEQARRRSERWESQSEEQRYAHVLGLVGKFTAADVKRAYRELLPKYHPDKVNHLGDEFKRIAEVNTREIIEAYDYFRKKHDIR